VTLTDIGTTTPATGADPQLDATLGTYPLANASATSRETNGVYTVGPVHFDRSGRWIATLHFYDPLPAKHTHVSYYVDVP
jgi:hypothetical protein